MKRPTFEELVNAPIPKTIINEPFVELRLVVNNQRKEGRRMKEPENETSKT
jgi:hypothetical protein